VTVKYEVHEHVKLGDPPNRWTYLTVYSGNSFWAMLLQVVKVKQRKPHRPVRVLWR
jgi:hypothetical protein